MKYLTIILVLSLAIITKADNASMARELQALVGGVKAKGSAKGQVKFGGSVKAKVAAPKIKAKVSIPKIKVKAPKIKVKAPKVGLKVGAKAKQTHKLKVKIGAKPKVSLKFGAKAKQTHKVKIGAKVKSHGKLKFKVGGKSKKAHGKLKIRIGGKNKLKTHGKLNIKIHASAKKTTPKPTGTCPMASKMGFVSTEAYVRTSKKVCGSLKTTCCTANSLNSYHKKFKAWMRKSSKALWTVTKLPTVVGVIMGNLSKSTCPGEKTAANLQKLGVKATVVKNRILQSLKRKSRAKGKRVRHRASPKMRVRHTPRIRIKHRASPKLRIKHRASTKLRIKHRASPKIRVKSHFRVKKSKFGKKHFKLRQRGGIKVRIHLRHKLKYKIAKGFENKHAPKDFMTGTKCRASFTTAYNMLYGVNHARKAVASKGLGCLRAIAKIRGELSCAACDNTKSKFFSNPNNFHVQPANLENLGQCIMFIRYLNKYKTFMNNILDYVSVLGKDINGARNILNDFDVSGTENCENNVDSLVVAKKRILQTINPKSTKKADTLFDWNMSTQIGKTTAELSWNAYIKMPQASTEKNMKMTNACMTTGPFKRFWDKVMFGEIDEKIIYKTLKPLFKTLKFLNSHVSNRTAQLTYTKLMGGAWASKFTFKIKRKSKKFKSHMKSHTKKFKLNLKSRSKKFKKNSNKFKLKIKAGAKASVKKNKKFGLKVKVGTKKSKRHLQTVTTKPVVTGAQSGINTNAYAKDVTGVPTALKGDADQNAPAFAALMKITAASFIILLSVVF